MLGTIYRITGILSTGVAVINIDRCVNNLTREWQTGVCGAGVVVIFNTGGADLRKPAAAEIEYAADGDLRVIRNRRAAAARAARLAQFATGASIAVIATTGFRLGIADGSAGGITRIADIFSSPLTLRFTAALAGLSQIGRVRRTANLAGIFGDSVRQFAEGSGFSFIAGDGS